MNAALIREVRREVRRRMGAGRGSHGFDHVRRVLALCRRLGGDADREVLVLAALLHDVGRPEEDRSNGSSCHAEVGARLAGEILRRRGAAPQLVRKVQECVRTHRYRGRSRPLSREAKVLFDADKLDSLGAVGLGRAFLFAGEVGARLHNSEARAAGSPAYSREDTAFREYLVKLRHLPGRMQTEEGRRLARQRLAYMTEFFERLTAEEKGRL